MPPTIDHVKCSLCGTVHRLLSKRFEIMPFGRRCILTHREETGEDDRGPTYQRVVLSREEETALTLAGRIFHSSVCYECEHALKNKRWLPS